MGASAVHVHAQSSSHGANSLLKEYNRNYEQQAAAAKVFDDLSAGLVGKRKDSLIFCGGLLVLLLTFLTVFYAPAVCPLLFLAFAATCLPYRIVTFTQRKWIFFLVDFCYFANLACCAFLLFAPEDPALEATVYVLCEGPLAAALIAWQCAWVLGSPDHAISVLVHLLPGLALFCHRFLAHTRKPLVLATQIGMALARADPWANASKVAALEPMVMEAGRAGTGRECEGASTRTGADAAAAATGTGAAAASAAAAAWLSRGGKVLAAAVDVMRGRVPCTLATGSWSGSHGTCPAVIIGCGGDATGSCSGSSGLEQLGLAGAGVACYAQPSARPVPCPAPSWLWLGLAPLGFYLAWQLLYFLVVQVACRRLILSGGYDTSYRALARRAQRANNFLNRLVRSGGVTRRILMYGLLQLLFTLITQAWAVVTYHSLAAASLWQVVKFAVPLYLGVVHQCQRHPVQQLRAAAAKLAEAGVLPPGMPVSRPQPVSRPVLVTATAAAAAAMVPPATPPAMAGTAAAASPAPADG